MCVQCVYMFLRVLCLLNKVVIVLELTVGLVAANVQSDVALTLHVTPSYSGLIPTYVSVCLCACLCVRWGCDSHLTTSDTLNWWSWHPDVITVLPVIGLRK